MPAAVGHDALHAAIEDSLRRRFDDGIDAARSYGDEFVRVWRTAADGAIGGKLLRPRLLIESHRALTGGHGTVDHDDEDAVVELATAVELLHYSFLLHDDVIDGDMMRRGRPNLVGALALAADRPFRGAIPSPRAQHWGRSGALLMGDLLLTGAVLGFARVPVGAETRARLLDLLEHVVTETVAGELADVGLGDGVLDAELPAILRMTARKTAVYSFELPLRAAAILSGCTRAAEDALAEAAGHIGLAYQLQDDLMSVFGDAREHGKDPRSDLREGKETAIIAYARMTSAWSAIAPRFGAQDLTPAEASLLVSRLRACGAEAFVETLIAERLQEARSIVDDAVRDALMPAGIRPVLLAVMDRTTGRRS